MHAQRGGWPPIVTRLFLVGVASAVFLALYHGFGAGMASYLIKQGKDHLAAGRTEAAVQTLAKAHQLAPERPETAALLGAHAFGSSNWVRAIELLTPLADSGDLPAEEQITTLDQIGRAHEALGQRDAATAAFRRIAERHPAAEEPLAIAGPLGLARLGEPAGALLTSPAANADAPWRGIALLHLEDAFGRIGYGSASGAAAIADASNHGVNAVSLRVGGRQRSVHDPAIRWGDAPAGGETDAAVVRAIRDAHLLGRRVLLKPHIMLETITDAEWRGTIEYADPAELAAWWGDYRGFILHYAKLAAAENVEAFCVGVELRAMANQAPAEWRRLIAAVREVYPGQLTYAANWYHEYREVTFWDALDFVGVQFFFPVASESADPDQDTLRRGVAEIASGLHALHLTTGRPVLLTEVGYKSARGAARDPWQWPEPGSRPDPKLQARAYRAVLEVFASAPWCGGLFWWNWLTDPTPGKKFGHDFTPQGKPAAEVVREFWR